MTPTQDDFMIAELEWLASLTCFTHVRDFPRLQQTKKLSLKNLWHGHIKSAPTFTWKITKPNNRQPVLSHPDLSNHYKCIGAACDKTPENCATKETRPTQPSISGRKSLLILNLRKTTIVFSQTTRQETLRIYNVSEQDNHLRVSYLSF